MHILKRRKINNSVEEIWQRDYLVDNLTHRKKGPAYSFLNIKRWYFWGKEYFKEKTEFCSYVTSCYKNNFVLSSFADEPAVIYKNGTKKWHYCNYPHRRELPAIIYQNGDQEYWFFGKRHREDGPAVIYGNKQYFFENGEFIKCIV
ncbi:MAG: hypothetical protein EKK64_06680 [Neisseriaceae bacterium]|nr:MAG: hypothetical protein EKK64_06680 [Neisseriaceae bacterium]